MAYSGSTKELVYLRLPSDYEMLDQVRVFLAAYCQQRFTSDLAERVGLATHELLENAIRFGRVADGLELHLGTNKDENRVWLTVVNHAVPTRVRILREWVEKLRREAEDEDLDLRGMVMRMQNEAGLPAHLGLSRLRYEADLAIELEEAGSRVAVTAIGEIRR